MIKLYDLAGADESQRWSPYCWRAKLALAHKGLDFVAIPWRYHQKALISPSGQNTVPVMVDGDRWIGDSWRIALHLDAAFPDRPGLFGPRSGADPSHALLMKNWTEQHLHPLLRQVTLLDMFHRLHSDDKAYFRSSRESAFGMTLEDISRNAKARLEQFRQELAPLRKVLESQPFLGGEGATFADYIVLAMLQWVEIGCQVDPLDLQDSLVPWRHALAPVLSRAQRGVGVPESGGA
ncbi:glutathione S-transferase family protein [Polaromonas sp.]|uniref:glutathione S-transferase family protein n=1 Tax=Polaromonas sp. TaxID=1869339 RepID=UPI001D5F16A8|nr:glutathione S-transferase family protein [Polaromonas sp.]MBT9476167.1 glutathione S-transferase family protein [Polaromonas sp.]